MLASVHRTDRTLVELDFQEHIYQSHLYSTFTTLVTAAARSIVHHDDNQIAESIAGCCAQTIRLIQIAVLKDTCYSSRMYYNTAVNALYINDDLFIALLPAQTHPLRIYATRCCGKAQ